MSGSGGAAWLDGDVARTFTCDASVTPVVLGEVNPTALDDLIRLCVQLDHGTDNDGTPPAVDTTRAREALEQAIIGKAVDLRTRWARLVPAPPAARRPARRAQPAAGRRGQPRHPGRDPPRGDPAGSALPVPGGCDQPAAACEVHHVTHKANGGKTSVRDCALFFHHQVIIHQMGWTVVLNPDGTTTAWNKDKTKILHSHGPPVRPG